jgi:hypothetical protein
MNPKVVNFHLLPAGQISVAVDSWLYVVRHEDSSEQPTPWG